MPTSKLRIIKRCIEYEPLEAVSNIPRKVRGIYVLYKQNIEKVRGKVKTRYDDVYVGAAYGEKVGGVRGRIAAHTKSKNKKNQWSHFSIFQVWENIREDKVRELEGLFRHIYRKDTNANRLNIAKKFQRLEKASITDFDKLKDDNS